MLEVETEKTIITVVSVWIITFSFSTYPLGLLNNTFSFPLSLQHTYKITNTPLGDIPKKQNDVLSMNHI